MLKSVLEIELIL